ncbi:MAG: hypothetical protein OEV40_13400 [Acidimicrobiia bacterium]|nr:hypothetical protein [Acidimicrobiia bacterium]
MCASSSGALTYFGSNRTNTDSIELPACFAGGGLFVAENNGFTYWVDTAASQLQVLDPGGALVVDEAFTSPVVPDLSGGANAC